MPNGIRGLSVTCVFQLMREGGNSLLVLPVSCLLARHESLFSLCLRACPFLPACTQYFTFPLSFSLFHTPTSGQEPHQTKLISRPSAHTRRASGAAEQSLTVPRYEMPTLKQLTCQVERETSPEPLKEYSTNYGDGVVETFLAIPDAPAAFTIHLTSSGYIAPGLAMFVYIDGVYQCNRNRKGLVAPDDTVPPDFYEVDFRVRQKEEPIGSGRFLSRPWRFEDLNIGRFAHLQILALAHHPKPPQIMHQMSTTLSLAT